MYIFIALAHGTNFSLLLAGGPASEVYANQENDLVVSILGAAMT